MQQQLEKLKHASGDAWQDMKEGATTAWGSLADSYRKAAEHGHADAGFRTVFNCNAAAGQAVFHIHLHLLGGRTLTWPPG